MHQQRVRPLRRGMAALLRQHLAEREMHRRRMGSGYTDLRLVFLRPDGRPHSDNVFRRRLTSAAQEAGVVRITPKDFRSTGEDTPVRRRLAGRVGEQVAGSLHEGVVRALPLAHGSACDRGCRRARRTRFPRRICTGYAQNRGRWCQLTGLRGAIWRRGGIRTHVGLPPTRFPGVRPKPLGDLSISIVAIESSGQSKLEDARRARAVHVRRP